MSRTGMKISLRIHRNTPFRVNISKKNLKNFRDLFLGAEGVALSTLLPFFPEPSLLDPPSVPQNNPARSTTLVGLTAG